MGSRRSYTYDNVVATQAGTLQNPRLKAMVIPREHGAWGMLLVPLTTGAIVAAGTGANFRALGLFVVAGALLDAHALGGLAWYDSYQGPIALGTSRRYSRVARSCGCCSRCDCGTVFHGIA